MACDRSTLMTQAMANGFSGVAQVPLVWRSVVLELLNEATGNPQTKAQLMAQAAANDFGKIAQNPILFRGVILQLMCGAGGGA